jgi:hypothetical protein
MGASGQERKPYYWPGRSAGTRHYSAKAVRLRGLHIHNLTTALSFSSLGVHYCPHCVDDHYRRQRCRMLKCDVEIRHWSAAVALPHQHVQQQNHAQANQHYFLETCRQPKRRSVECLPMDLLSASVVCEDWMNGHGDAEQRVARRRRSKDQRDVAAKREEVLLGPNASENIRRRHRCHGSLLLLPSRCHCHLRWSRRHEHCVEAHRR